jgi:hypothetical protein
MITINTFCTCYSGTGQIHESVSVLKIEDFDRIIIKDLTLETLTQRFYDVMWFFQII